jgi:hypothetical protein
MESELTPEEKGILQEILRLASGVDCLAQLKQLTDRQRAVLPSLQRQGYVLTSLGSYMVIKIPDNPN